MRILLDTNIFIPIEPASAADVARNTPTCLELIRLCNMVGHQTIIHPLVSSDLARDRDRSRADLRELSTPYQNKATRRSKVRPPGRVEVSKEVRQGSQQGSQHTHSPLLPWQKLRPNISSLDTEALTPKRYGPNKTHIEEMTVLSRVTARATRVLGAAVNFAGKTYRLGGMALKLDKKGLTHILSRHHPNFLDGSQKAIQTFFRKSQSVDDIVELIGKTVSANRNRLMQIGPLGSGTVTATIEGVTYKLGITAGRIGQFFPVF